uniref:Uncharacterized protein n=1 Tax=Yersinia enterocolitica W22703 TaxID=913028 RepID=F4N7N4_YEREN|nr:hypothetical protein YEW_KF44190 [Yersinia enterocolitica W22703]
MASNTQVLPDINVTDKPITDSNDNIYEDQTIGAELTKKDINRVAWRSMLLQASFNYERMQASGWLYGLLPALKKIHTNKNDLARAMKGHMGFFNTHPFLVTFVIGIILAMERSKQDVNSIQSTKIAVGAPAGRDRRCYVLAYLASYLRWDWCQFGLARFYSWRGGIYRYV